MALRRSHCDRSREPKRECPPRVKATLTPPCSLAFVAAPPPTRRFTFEPTHTNQQTAKHCNIAEVGRHVRAGRKHERAENQQPREDGKNHPTLPGTGNAPTPSIAFRWEPIFRASPHEHLLGLGRGDINADMARPFFTQESAQSNDRMRNTLCEQMFSASRPSSDIPRCGLALRICANKRHSLSAVGLLQTA
jgi:hypothetical protein